LLTKQVPRSGLVAPGRYSAFFRSSVDLPRSQSSCPLEASRLQLTHSSERTAGAQSSSTTTAINQPARGLTSQQPRSDERLLNLSQLVRGQVHVGNGAGNQFTGDPKPLLSRCRPWPVIEAIKDGTFRADAVDDVGH